MKAKSTMMAELMVDMMVEATEETILKVANRKLANLAAEVKAEGHLHTASS